MWTSLILSMLLLHCLVALPAPEPKDLDSWSADTASQEVDNSVMLENQNDSTCVTHVFCYIVNESKRVLVQSCKSGHSTYSISLKVCTETKPDGSVEATAEATSTTVATTAATKTTVTTTTDSTNTSEPWSAEATCLTATKSTVLQNQDDPTCTTYLYCYVSNGSATALIRTCKTDKYFDAATRICSETKPDYCT